MDAALAVVDRIRALPLRTRADWRPRRRPGGLDAATADALRTHIAHTSSVIWCQIVCAFSLQLRDIAG